MDEACTELSDIDALLLSRRSVRAFQSRPVAKRLIETVLRSARSAPSGANLQPGKFYVLVGDALKNVIADLTLAQQTERPSVAQYSYFPEPMPAHLKARQRDAGYALYNALGIQRRDVEKRKQQFAKNYSFFDAPVGIVVTIDKAMGKGCFMDLGNALMALFLSAHGNGLGASGIGALANHADVVHKSLNLPSDELVVCGIALGYTNNNAPESNIVTTRLELDEFVSFRGFD